MGKERRCWLIQEVVVAVVVVVLISSSGSSWVAYYKLT